MYVQLLGSLTHPTEHPRGLSSEESYSAGATGSIPGSGRPRAKGHINPLQCSCLKAFMDRGSQQATLCRVAELDTTEAI